MSVTEIDYFVKKRLILRNTESYWLIVLEQWNCNHDSAAVSWNGTLLD